MIAEPEEARAGKGQHQTMAAAKLHENRGDDQRLAECDGKRKHGVVGAERLVGAGDGEPEQGEKADPGEQQRPRRMPFRHPPLPGR